MVWHARVNCGFGTTGPGRSLSRGQVLLQTSKGPVGAPTFCRDVPLMPSEMGKGVIKPLPDNALPLIAWRLGNVSENGSRLLPEGLHTWADCRSYPRDNRKPGMDLDRPHNDKGLAGAISARILLYQSKIPFREKR